MPPSVIPLAVLVRLGLVNKAEEGISANFLENMRKKSYVHTEVSFLNYSLHLPD